MFLAGRLKRQREIFVLHNRFTELTIISEIPEIPNSPPPPPSNASPPHTQSHTTSCSYSYIYYIYPQSPISLLNSPEHITVTLHVYDHSYALLPHPPKQTDAVTKVNNWMNDGSVFSNHSSSAEAETAATSPAPTTYAEAAAASPTLPPALAIASPIHSLTHSNTCALHGAFRGQGAALC